MSILQNSQSLEFTNLYSSRLNIFVDKIKEKEYYQHQQRIQDIVRGSQSRSKIEFYKDCDIDKDYLKLKKYRNQYNVETQYSQLQRENQMMLDRLIQKSTVSQNANKCQYQKKVSVLHFYNQRIQAKINEENQKLAFRLIQQKPVVKTSDILKETNKYQKISKHMLKFPQPVSSNNVKSTYSSVIENKNESKEENNQQ